MRSETMLDIKNIDQGVSLAPILSRNPELLAVSLVGERSRYSLRVREENRAALSAAIEIELPVRIGETSIQFELKMLCLGPDEWLLLCERESPAGLTKALTKVAAEMLCSVVDISHRNVAFTLRGPLGVTLLNAGCPLDMSLKAFPVGKCARTVYEHAEIIILREDEEQFHVETWRSFAPYLATYFSAVARGLG